MATSEAAEENPPKKKSKGPILIGLVLFVLLGAGGFFGIYSGMLESLLRENLATESNRAKAVQETPAGAFVPLEPLLISLGPAASNRHLRFSATLEVAAPQAAYVADLKPRVMDVLNGYLRAVDIAELQDPSALIRLRAQMLRRVQIVTGEGRVRDLLVTEFVLN